MTSWAMTRHDWTIAFDDYLVGRHARCTLCGSTSLAWVWARPVYSLAIGIGLCRSCHREDPHHQRVDALLAARYDPQRWGQWST
jgi:hypothetical protein